MIEKLEQLVRKVEELSSRNEQLRKQIEELYEAGSQPGTPDSPWAKIPLIAAEMGRGMLEAECHRWKVIAVLGWGLLIVAAAAFGALALLVH